jgi:hypothetical protein
VLLLLFIKLSLIPKLRPRVLIWVFRAGQAIHHSSFDKVFLEVVEYGMVVGTVAIQLSLRMSFVAELVLYDADGNRAETITESKAA